MKGLYLIFSCVCLLIACSRSPELVIDAPGFSNDTCLFYYSYRCDTLYLDARGRASVELTPLMKLGMIRVIDKGIRVQYYSGQEDLTILIDRNNKISFKGQHARASDYSNRTEYPYLNWFKVEKASREELDVYLKAHLDTLNQILEGAALNDQEFIQLEKESFRYDVEMFRLSLLLSRNEVTREDLEACGALLREDEQLVPMRSYAFALYRFPVDWVDFQQRDSLPLPYESMRKVLDYYLSHYKNAVIREVAIHQLAMEYMGEHGNDAYLDKVYRAHVKDTVLLKDYEKLSRKWNVFWTGESCTAAAATNQVGEKLDFARYRGKYVLMDIWATWCSPCRREQDVMFQLEPKFENKNIVFLTLSCDRFRKVWEKYCQEHNMKGENHYNIQDKQGLMDLYAIRTIPRFILLDPDGKLLSANFFTPSEPKFERTLSYLLEK